jgi:hypothetical protein
MSFLTLSLPKQSATFFQLLVMKYGTPASIAVATIIQTTNSFGNSTAPMAQQELAAFARIDPYRGKASCESTAAVTDR